MQYTHLTLPLRFWLCLMLLRLLLGGGTVSADARNDEGHFERHVRPVLLKHCSACHGDEMQEGDLRVDSREALLRGGTRGPAIEPGDGNGSLLVAAARHTHTDLVMPPEAEPLTPKAIKHLTRWIDRGAIWPAAMPLGEPPPSAKIAHFLETHWAFAPVFAARSPDASDVKNDAAAAEAIDRMIDAKLASADLTPARPASRAQLIRRVTFDLTGLPPAPAEIDAFVTDASPDAYEQLIERLLESPAYGERWGRVTRTPPETLRTIRCPRLFSIAIM